MEDLIKLFVANIINIWITLFIIGIFFPWLGLNFSKITTSQMPNRFKLIFSFVCLGIATILIVYQIGSVNQTPDIQNQSLYKNKNGTMLVFNLDKVGHSNFFPVTSFYVFQRGQKPDLYIGMMKFPSGSENEESLGKFKDYSVHGKCEGDVKFYRIKEGINLEYFKLEFDPKIAPKKELKEFCKEDEAEVTKHSYNY